MEDVPLQVLINMRIDHAVRLGWEAPGWGAPDCIDRGGGGRLRRIVPLPAIVTPDRRLRTAKRLNRRWGCARTSAAFTAGIQSLSQ